MSKLYIDTDSLAGDKLSGVGQYVNFLTQELVRQSTVPITCLLPFNHRDSLENKGYKTDGNLQQQLTPFGRINSLWAMLYPPIPMDWFYGQGAYLFPNYKHYYLSKKSQKYVLVHDLTHLKYPETMKPRSRKFLTRVVPRALKSAEKIIVISQAVRAEIQAEYGRTYDLPDHKFIYAPPAADPNIYKPLGPRAIKEVKTKHKIKGDYLLFVSSIEPRKNLLAQLDGFANSRAGDSGELGLVIVGGLSWMNENVEAKITELKERGLQIIQPTDFVSNNEVASLMSGATALLSVSLYEGFGMPIIEAQACKCPVITSNVSSMPEVAGDAAILVNPNRPKAIAAAIDRIHQDKSLQVKLKQRGYINQQKYSWAKSAKTILEEIIHS